MLLVIFFSMPEEFICSIGVHQVASLYLLFSCMWIYFSSCSVWCSLIYFWRTEKKKILIYVSCKFVRSVDFLNRELTEKQISPSQELQGWSKANFVLPVERQKLPWRTCSTSLRAVVLALSCEGAPSAVRGEKSRCIVHLCRGGETLENLKREAPPERSDVLQLCSISYRSVCRGQFSPHDYLSAVRAGREERAV